MYTYLYFDLIKPNKHGKVLIIHIKRDRFCYTNLGNLAEPVEFGLDYCLLNNCFDFEFPKNMYASNMIQTDCVFFCIKIINRHTCIFSAIITVL